MMFNNDDGDDDDGGGGGDGICECVCVFERLWLCSMHNAYTPSKYHTISCLMN